METRKSTDAELTSDEKDVLTRFESAGWFVNQVFTEGNAPDFAYTFGFYETFQHPEVIMFGLPLDTMLTILNEVGKLLGQGIRYAAGDRTDDLLDGYPCEFRHVDPSHYKETLTWTGWFYKGAPFPALQLFWPDRAGHFPWDSRCEEGIRSAQPDLGRALTLN